MDNNEQVIREKWIVFGLIGLYLILSYIWHINTIATWDDDCVTRYFNSKAALHDPKQFIDLWNRPLFIIIFFLPFQISKDAVLLMTVISAFSAYALYLGAKEMGVRNAYLVVPMMLFQAFAFVVSGSSLAEPLAAAIIAFSLLFYVRKQYLAFVIVGSLLPLARLELSPLLIFWAYVLYREQKWKYIFILAVPSILWSLAGTALTGDPIWLYNQTLGKNADKNIYGHKTFGHYFQRYIYITGPVIFYFFFIGIAERFYKRKVDIFPTWAFVLAFMIYVVFSWKLNMGQAAGFLRHLVAITPLSSLIAVYGYNYWLASISSLKVKLAEKKNSPADKPLPVVNAPAPVPQTKQAKLQASKDKAKQAKLSSTAAIKQKQKSADQTNKAMKYRVLFYSFLMVLLAIIFFSQKLRSHFKLLDNVKDYSNLMVVAALTLVYLLLILIFRKKAMITTVQLMIGLFMSVTVMGFTLVTQPPDAHNNPERKVMAEISELFSKGYLKDYTIFVNHPWFFWVNDVVRTEKTYLNINQDALNRAADSTIVIWENHYNNRLGTDVPMTFFQNKPEYVELIRKMSTDSTLLILVYQKIKNPDVQGQLRIFDRLIAYAPEQASPHINRGSIYFNKLHNFPAALADYDKAIAIDSNNVDANYSKGLILLNTQKFEDAKKCFLKIARLVPKSHEAHYYSGIAMSNLGDHSNAVNEFTRAIEENSRFEAAYLSRGNSYSALGQFEKAVSDYSVVISLQPNNAEAYYNKATALKQLGKTEESQKFFQTAQQLGHS